MIILPNKFSVVSESNKEGIFEIAGLYPGYGITVGNSLRRVLLSSIEGAAVTYFKVNDVPHEFTTLKGVYENALEVMLNLKQLSFKLLTISAAYDVLSSMLSLLAFCRSCNPTALK